MINTYLPLTDDQRATATEVTIVDHQTGDQWMGLRLADGTVHDASGVIDDEDETRFSVTTPITRQGIRDFLATMRSCEGTTADGYIITVNLSRAYGRRRYMLSYLLPDLVHGSSIMLDTTAGTLWAALADEDHENRGDAARTRLRDAMRPALDAARDLQRAHGTPIVYRSPALPGREVHAVTIV